jgi:hypothetical protein
MTGLGTRLHRDALIVRLMNDPRFTSIHLEAVDSVGNAVWPENLSLEELEREKLAYTMQGELPLFYMEYYGRVRDEATQLFKERYFRWAPPKEPLTFVSIYVDPAISEDRRADDAVICVAGMTEYGHIYVLDMFGQTPEMRAQGQATREIVDEYFRLSKLHGALQHGVESIAYQRALIHVLQEEMFRKNQYFEIMAVTHGRVNKRERIRGMLHSRYAAGYITHAKRFPELESQLQDFSSGGIHDDYPDALAGAIALLDPYAAAAAGEEDLTKDEYPPLEDQTDGDWRTAP